jgi:hypothetical protein
MPLVGASSFRQERPHRVRALGIDGTTSGGTQHPTRIEAGLSGWPGAGFTSSYPGPAAFGRSAAARGTRPVRFSADSMAIARRRAGCALLTASAWWLVLPLSQHIMPIRPSVVINGADY